MPVAEWKYYDVFSILTLILILVLIAFLGGIAFIFNQSFYGSYPSSQVSSTFFWISIILIIILICMMIYSIVIIATIASIKQGLKKEKPEYYSILGTPKNKVNVIDYTNAVQETPKISGKTKISEINTLQSRPQSTIQPTISEISPGKDKIQLINQTAYLQDLLGA